MGQRVVHGVAVLTFLLALPLVFLGAQVTTMDVGMVDTEGYRGPLYFFYNWAGQGIGWLIEHGHRQVGFLVGFSAIALVLASFCLDSRRWVKWLSLGVLALVSLQGVLGIFRIKLNALMGRDLALVHACFAQVVFATLALTAVVTRKGWPTGQGVANVGLRRWAWITAGLVYLQLVLGAVIRHQNVAWAVQGHVLGALLVVGFSIWLATWAWLTDRVYYRSVVWMLTALLVVQSSLGTEALMSWVRRYFDFTVAARESMAMLLLRSGHFLVGSMIFATMCLMAVKANLAVRGTQA